MTAQAHAAADTASGDAAVPTPPKNDHVDDVAGMPSGESPALPMPAAFDAVLEIGGRDGPEPTRYGDWEMRGRCIDF